MKVNELLIENELAKPQVRLVGSNMAAANMDISPENISQFSGVPVRDVKKYVAELERKRPLSQWVEHPTDPTIHRIIATLFWYKHNQDKRTIENIEHISGLDYNEFLELFKKHHAEINQSIHVGINALPQWKPRWGGFVEEEKRDLIADAFKTLSRGEHKAIASIDAARYIVQKHNLGDDPEALRRPIDKMLETMPELEKYRVVGRSIRGPEETYPGVKAW